MSASDDFILGLAGIGAETLVDRGAPGIVVPLGPVGLGITLKRTRKHVEKARTALKELDEIRAAEKTGNSRLAKMRQRLFFKRHGLGFLVR